MKNIFLVFALLCLVTRIPAQELQAKLTIVANKVKGIRASVYYGGHEDTVKFARAHNNANVLSLGARFLSVEQAERAVDLWIETGFEGGRHSRRIEKIDKIEK